MGTSILERYLARTPKSAALAAEARRWLPGGVVSDTRVFEPYGIYVSHAEGVFKRDVDGNQYLDFFGGHGANLLGHGAPAIVDAVREAMGHGTQFAANQPLEVALAREVIRHLPHAERVRFTGSGTEATLLAIRLARAHTGRAKIVRFASHYHGWHDHAASGYAGEFDGSAAPGVLREIADNTLLLAPGDAAALSAALSQHGASIAAFLIEPVGTHFGVVPLVPEFLKAVEDAARSCGALFILDEVLSGFRVALGGAQAVYGLRPDLTTLAKILCGGMPGGAVAGRADILDLMDPNLERRRGRGKVLHQGTFSGNPVSMAAGLAALEQIEATLACERVNALGARARHALNALSEAERLPFDWYGEFSAFHLKFTRVRLHRPGSIEDLREYLARPQPLTNRLRMALNNAGVDVNTRCSGLLSAAHDETHIDRLVEAVAEAAHRLRIEGLLPNSS
jgi:glutamate-1-semialdehyde 2,1-aminomutase